MVEVVLDGKSRELSPRVREMVRQLLEAAEYIDGHDVGVVEMHFAHNRVTRETKVSVGIRRALPGRKVTE